MVIAASLVVMLVLAVPLVVLLAVVDEVVMLVLPVPLVVLLALVDELIAVVGEMEVVELALEEGVGRS